MARLPTIGGDGGNWGSVLNEFLEVGHNADGTLKGTLRVFNVKDYGATGDGITDDRAAILAAIAAAGAGSCIYFPAGTYIISAKLATTADNQHFRGDGWASIIKQNSSGYDKSAFSVRHDGASFESLCMESPTQTGYENAAIAAAKQDGSQYVDLRVTRCFMNKFSYGVTVTKAVRAVITYNRIYSTGDDGAEPDPDQRDTGGAIQLSESHDCLIAYNDINGDPLARFQHGMYIAANYENLRIIGNIIRNFFSAAIHVYCNSEPGSPSTSTGLIIDGNIMKDCAAWGIILSHSGSKVQIYERVKIVNNSIDCPWKSIQFSAWKISDVIVANNDFHNTATTMFLVSQAATYGGSGPGYLQNCSIIDNLFDNWEVNTPAMDLSGAQSITGLDIRDNRFVPGALGGTTAIETDDPAVSTAYSDMRWIGNRGSGVVDPAYYAAYTQASFLLMQGNSWDRGAGYMTRRYTKITAADSPYTLPDSVDVVHCTTAGGSIAINLPAVADNYGREVEIINIDGTNTVTLDGSGVEKIDNADTYALNGAAKAVRIRAVETAAWIVTGKG